MFTSVEICTLWYIIVLSVNREAGKAATIEFFIDTGTTSPINLFPPLIITEPFIQQL